jgi:hypothetical protein
VENHAMIMGRVRSVWDQKCVQNFVPGKNLKGKYQLMRFSFFWDVTQRRLVFTEVSVQSSVPKRWYYVSTLRKVVGEQRSDLLRRRLSPRRLVTL